MVFGAPAHERISAPLASRIAPQSIYCWHGNRCDTESALLRGYIYFPAHRGRPDSGRQGLREDGRGDGATGRGATGLPWHRISARWAGDHGVVLGEPGIDCGVEAKRWPWQSMLVSLSRRSRLGGNREGCTVGVRHPCQDFAASVQRPGGSLPPPGPPLAIFSVPGARPGSKLRAGPADSAKESVRQQTARREVQPEQRQRKCAKDSLHYQAQCPPCFQVPSQRRHHHVRPIAVQIVHRSTQRPHTAVQLRQQ